MANRENGPRQGMTDEELLELRSRATDTPQSDEAAEKAKMKKPIRVFDAVNVLGIGNEASP